MTKRKASDTTWEQIGTVLVDTGCIMIGDPCRLVDLEYGEMFPEGAALHQQIEQPAHDGQPGDQIIPAAVTLRTGIGDGYYPVMALIEDGTVTAVRIDFLDNPFIKALVQDVAPEKKQKEERAQPREGRHEPQPFSAA
jgi:hypothetical protein